MLDTLLFGACSSEDEPGGDATVAATDADHMTVNVVLKEWAVEPDAVSAPAGEVQFDVSNDGTVPHEMVIIRSDGAPDALPVEGGKVVEDEVDVVGEVAEFPAGASDSGTFNLEPGNYILICNIPEPDPVSRSGWV